MKQLGYSLLLLAAMLPLSLSAQSKTPVFKIRRGSTVLQSTRNVRRDTVPTYYSFGGPLSGNCWWTAPARYNALQAGVISHLYRSAETDTRQLFSMVTVGLQHTDDNKAIETVGINGCFGLQNQYTGISVYAMKTLLRTYACRSNLLRIGAAGDAATCNGETQYGFSPMAEIWTASPYDWYWNVQWVISYRLALGGPKLPEMHGWYFGVSYKYLIFQKSTGASS